METEEYRASEKPRVEVRWRSGVGGLSSSRGPDVTNGSDKPEEEEEEKVGYLKKQSGV